MNKRTYKNRIYNEDYDPTIQDAYKKSFHVDGTQVDLNVLDTAGQEEYEALQAQYMRECQAFILVYDRTKLQSVTDLDRFIAALNRCYDEKPFPVVLCGNKSDLVTEENGGEDPEVARHATRIAKEQLHNCPHFHSSAKDNFNVHVLFEEVVREWRKFREAERRAALANSRATSSSGKGLFGSLSHSGDVNKDLQMFQDAK